jgi:hypothetical protein
MENNNKENAADGNELLPSFGGEKRKVKKTDNSNNGNDSRSLVILYLRKKKSLPNYSTKILFFFRNCSTPFYTPFSDSSSSSAIRLGRCVDALLELAVAHPAEAQAGQWLPKLFRHLLNSVEGKTISRRQQQQQSQWGRWGNTY